MSTLPSAYAHADTTAIILAGGGSRRMGRDKSLLPVKGKSMIAVIADQLRPHFAEVILSTGMYVPPPLKGLLVVPDTKSDCGPLMGIATSLLHSANDLNFVTACDMPCMNMEFIQNMLHAAEDYDAVVPRHADGKIEPLHAVYHRRLRPLIQNLLESGINRVRTVFEQCRVRYVECPHSFSLVNLNTKKDYECYLKRTA